MLRLVGLIPGRGLIVLLLPNRIAAGLGVEGLRGRRAGGGSGRGWAHAAGGSDDTDCAEAVAVDARQQPQTQGQTI